MQEPGTLEPSLSPGDRAAAAAVKPVSQLFFGMACDRPLLSGPHIVLDDLEGLEVGRDGFDSLIAPAPGGPAIAQLRRADAWMSTRHARLTRRDGAWWIADAGSKNGTFVDGDAVDAGGRALADGALVRIGQTFLRFRDRLPRLVPGQRPDLPGLQTRHPLLAAQLEQLARVARSPLAVLVQGETGTGKELMARALHELSGARGAFVAVNCAALPAGVLEGELFGYRKGAFSGAARDHVGLVRAAEGGTLFLDEIGDLPLPAQAALLRVLQEREVLPLGETRPVKVDFRLVSATHQDLGQMAARQAFRADLRARIADFVLVLPALRERREDLGLLVGAMLARTGQGAARFDVDAVTALYRHAWPGNVRELERVLGAATVLVGAGERIGVAQLPALVREPATAAAPPPARPRSPEDQALHAQLTDAFARHQGSIAAVARELGKDRVQIRRWMKRLGIDPGRSGE